MVLGFYLLTPTRRPQNGQANAPADMNLEPEAPTEQESNQLRLQAQMAEDLEDEEVGLLFSQPTAASDTVVSSSSEATRPPTPMPFNLPEAAGGMYYHFLDSHSYCHICRCNSDTDMVTHLRNSLGHCISNVHLNQTLLRHLVRCNNETRTCTFIFRDDKTVLSLSETITTGRMIHGKFIMIDKTSEPVSQHQIDSQWIIDSDESRLFLGHIVLMMRTEPVGTVHASLMRTLRRSCISGISSVNLSNAQAEDVQRLRAEKNIGGTDYGLHNYAGPLL